MENLAITFKVLFNSYLEEERVRVGNARLKESSLSKYARAGNRFQKFLDESIKEDDGYTSFHSAVTAFYRSCLAEGYSLSDIAGTLTNLGTIFRPMGLNEAKESCSIIGDLLWELHYVHTGVNSKCITYLDKVLGRETSGKPAVRVPTVSMALANEVLTSAKSIVTTLEAALSAVREEEDDLERPVDLIKGVEG